jgi:hypothetical protein
MALRARSVPLVRSRACGIALALTLTVPTLAAPAAERFRIEVEQDGRRVAVTDHEAAVRRAPFDLILVLPDGGGVALRASSRPDLYDRARRGAPLGEVFIPAQSGPEDPFNAERQLWVDVPNIQHFWQYDSKESEHRFDEVTPSGGLYRCRRRVALLGLGPEAKSVEKSNLAAVYLVFLAGSASKDWMKTVESQRDYLKVSFAGASAAAAPSQAAGGETPTQAALRLLFAQDVQTAQLYLPEVLLRYIQGLDASEREKVLQGFLTAQGLEAMGAKVSESKKGRKTEITFDLPHAGKSFRVTLEKERIEGSRATLEGHLQRKGAPSEPVFVRMILEGGRWRVAGVQGRSAPDPASPEAIWAGLDDPRLPERLEAQSRAANEAAAIGDIRALISAELAFSSVNRGYYAGVECLEKPSTCLTGYTGPEFLSPPFPWSSPRNGYKRTFHAGARPTREEIRRLRAAPSSLKSFAFVVVPLEPGKTGDRGFCGDATGRICVTSDGSAPLVRAGQCGPPCTELK